MKTLRNTDEWVGLLVVLSVGAFIAAALHAGLLSDWFRPTASLRIVLPDTGSGGLSAGADVQVLGTKVGTIRRVVVDPSQRLYAQAELEEQSKGFIRRDSVAVIKKSFGVAGAAFLDVSRGTGQPLDWKFAVIDATTERAPTENIGALIDEVKLKIYPVLDNAGRTMKALASTAESIEQGNGNVGRLVKGDELMNEIGPILANLRESTEALQTALGDVRKITGTVSGPEGLPALLTRLDTALASVQSAARDLARATPAITRNVTTGAANLPALLAQGQQTAAELEKLSNQLRHTWPLSGAAAPESRRLPATAVRP